MQPLKRCGKISSPFEKRGGFWNSHNLKKQTIQTMVATNNLGLKACEIYDT